MKTTPGKSPGLLIWIVLRMTAVLQAPAPEAVAMGRHPGMKASEVMAMGRSRRCAASSAASAAGAGGGRASEPGERTFRRLAEIHGGRGGPPIAGGIRRHVEPVCASFHSSTDIDSPYLSMPAIPWAV